MNRGELWTVSGGVYAGKPRPALIIQEDLFDATESLVVIPLTTTVADAPITRVAISPAARVAEPSFAMVDKITTVRRSNLGARIGRAPSAVMADIERSLMVFLGLAS